MMEVFWKARAEAPCVLILEDLDSLINDKNRSFFLNQLDGLENNDGLLVIGTTNHFERLDPAITKRPSRFDRKLLVCFRDSSCTRTLTPPKPIREPYPRRTSFVHSILAKETQAQQGYLVP